MTSDLLMEDLFDLELFEQMREQGYVRVQDHPTLPLRICNYSEKAQYERVWNPVTLACRGLIIDLADRVVARPFTKFFNYSEHPDGAFALDARVTVTDKMDGSLGILYPVPGGHAIATRGSFTSVQALHATAVWNERYAGQFVPLPGHTYLFEIIYPGNRIVCDYGDLDDLVLLGAVHHRSGTVCPPSTVLLWPGPRAQEFSYASLGEALAAQPRPGAEGLIVVFDDGTTVKVKQDDYLTLHKIVTGLNARVVWEQLVAGKKPHEICEPLPDEFHAWVRSLCYRLARQAADLRAEAVAEHQTILGRLPNTFTRRDYAAHAVKSSRRALLFLLLDGCDIDGPIWQTLRPAGDDTPFNGRSL